MIDIANYAQSYLVHLIFIPIEYTYEQQLFVNLAMKHECGRPNQRFNRSASCLRFFGEL